MNLRILLMILTLGILFSFSYMQRQPKRMETTRVDLKSLDTTITISGCWVSEKYFNSIKEFKSPKKAQNGSCLIIIPNRNLQKTTILYDFHDWFDYYEILKNHNKYEIWETRNDSITKLQNTIELTSSNIKVDGNVFVKISPIMKKDIIHNGLKSEILIQEEILFKGNYLTSDGKNVEFKNNGQLIGLDDYHYYSPINDYYDEGMQVDQIILVKTEKNIEWKDLEWFGFKFNKDTLKLYKLNCLAFDSTSHNCGVVELGDLVYKLTLKK